MSASSIRKIKAILTDVDGCLTDGRIILGARKGEEFASFDVQDGVGHKLAEAMGMPIVWLTGRQSAPVARRAKILGITKLIQKRVDKVEAATAWCRSQKLDFSQIAYLGDDLVDLPLLKLAGWSVAPSNARGEVKSAVDYVTRASGGRGAFREMVETLLKKQGRWAAAVRKYAQTNRPMV